MPVRSYQLVWASALNFRLKGYKWGKEVECKDCFITQVETMLHHLGLHNNLKRM